jgi:hypothetical protein
MRKNFSSKVGKGTFPSSRVSSPPLHPLSFITVVFSRDFQKKSKVGKSL